MAGVLFFALALAACPFPHYLLLALILHEGGHLILGLTLGFGLPQVSLGGPGIRLFYHGTHTLKRELSLILGGCAFGLLPLAFPFLPSQLRLYSLSFSLTSLMPVSGLDGGGALLLALETFMLPDRAQRTCTLISRLFTVLFWVFAVAVQLKIGPNLTLMLLSVYLTVAAAKEFD